MAFPIILCVLTLTVQNVFKKDFGRRNIPADYTYSGIVTLFALVFFLFTAKGAVFATDILPYSLGFAAVYVGCTVSGILALRWGSLAITSLLLSYSLIIPTLYGVITGDPVGPVQVAGLAALLVSAFLVRGERSTEEAKGISAKWLIAVAVSFVCNGFCSVIQTAQQRAFGGQYNSSFMILALAIGGAVSLLIGLITERRQLPGVLHHGLVSAALCGLCNGATNYLVMVIVAAVAASVFFPVLSAGQIVLLFILSVTVYKERFLPRQLVGMLLGLVSLVLLNL